ncbi:hypothetical protein HO133_002152 [Letharia lupina]|uniref:Nuclear GTPase SLIP-GC n=1 Tax=Letharia lupina TaxID=560253 RepID=A0A8H6CD51_9LECA|nr:uncharacterized protein HO133_002152 [Letharia lupina]KAF6221297.1 hypothetical protein HO133_002152 [Letharia lupina]
MADLDTYMDKVIVFEAIKASDASHQVTRQPLQPTNAQIPSPTRRSSHKAADIKPSLDGASDENHTPLSHSAVRNRLTPHSGATSPLSTSDHAGGSVDMAGFDRYYADLHDRIQVSYPDYSDGQLHDALRRIWINESESERANYAAKPVPFDHRVHGIKTEPTAETKFHETPPLVEPPLSAAELEEQKHKSFQLQTLLKDAGPRMLEASVEQGVKLLDQLKDPLLNKMETSPDAEQWIQQIDNLIKQAVRTKTVIGVVGNTGAGKSSVINAMLDEERLVPTNCMRACTAVVTEISYNYEEKPYRAQIEFISPADWEKELNTLYQDLLDGDGKVSRDCANEDTDAGIAYAKIKAVYPRKTKEDIANSSIQTMLREVSHILGKSRDIEEKDSLVFYKKLQTFVDSKEKSTSNKDKDKKERREMEVWPLIRVVRIYVKSRALATGAVIVDLPGVHDANAARAAVAEGYMKQCTGLWIVAPINRAVDDKAAKSLLGESFKRQLKMDGGFNSVTFICSKTDDISLEEAQDSLGLSDEMEPDWEELEKLVKKTKLMKKQMDEMKDTKAVYGESMNDIDEQIEIWDGLKEKLEGGKTVFPPRSESAGKKRKGKGTDRARKKQRRTKSSDDEGDDVEESDYHSDDSDEYEKGSENESESQEPLTEEQLVAKLQELRATKKEARAQRGEITERINQMRKEIDESKNAEEKIESKMSAMCIEGRNAYSKGAIQQDFAAGIKELDQELAAEEDEENFNPDAEIRDYDEVARGLPVFCVSSRGYQKLQGRLRKDPHIAGFTNIEETEIPQLQTHCEKLTETGRSANCRTFINKLSQLLNSLTLWASSDGTSANMTAEQRAREARYLHKGLKSLESGLETAVKTACKELGDEFADNIYDKYETAISNAANDSIATALKWGAPVNREDRAAGGLHWSTYKAICRRNGIYTNGQGPHEWNVELAEPMMKLLASGWEKAFSRRSPMVMASFARNAAASLKNFHKDIEARARQIGTGIAGVHMLQQQVGNYENLLKDLSATVKDMINTNQKEINREFVPVIEQAMAAAYEACVEERGTGSFARMKAAMNSHVAQERHTMFQSSAENVKTRLSVMLKELEVYMNDKADEVYIAMRRDYNSVLGGGEVPQNGEILPKTQRLVRKEMMRIINGVEKVFQKIAGLEVKDEDDEDNNNVAHSSDDEDGGRVVRKKEEGENTKVKREASPSRQLEDQASLDEPMAGPDSDCESKTKLESPEAQERLDGLVPVDSGDSEGSESSDGSGSS